MMVEHFKNEGTSHSSSDLLKICVKMGASWSAQVTGIVYFLCLRIASALGQVME